MGGFELRLDPRKEFLGADRLAEVVVRAQLKSAHSVLGRDAVVTMYGAMAMPLQGVTVITGEADHRNLDGLR
jgi:hypothetical protein